MQVAPNMKNDVVNMTQERNMSDSRSMLWDTVKKTVRCMWIALFKHGDIACKISRKKNSKVLCWGRFISNIKVALPYIVF